MVNLHFTAAKWVEDTTYGGGRWWRTGQRQMFTRKMNLVFMVILENDVSEESKNEKNSGFEFSMEEGLAYLCLDIASLKK